MSTCDDAWEREVKANFSWCETRILDFGHFDEVLVVDAADTPPKYGLVLRSSTLLLCVQVWSTCGFDNVKDKQHASDATFSGKLE